MKKSQGFTMIELVMVILILGVLAAMAVPKFVSLQAESRQAATDGIAGALASGSAVNFSARSAGNTSDTVAVANCTDVVGTLQGSLASEYTVASAAIASGSSANCTVSRTTGETATFVGLGIN